MAYTVKIVYTGPANPENIRFVNPICRTYVLSNSYVDTAAYDGTVYDTNVRGFGTLDVMEPYASTAFPFPVPLSQFKLAVIGKDVLGADGKPTGAKEVSFKVDTYMEAFYYMEAGRSLEDQGFTVTVEEETP